MNPDAAIEVCQLRDANATRALGRRLAKQLLVERQTAGSAPDPPDDRSPRPPSLAACQILLLQGELGAGKTCLVQGLAEGLGITEPITSPTFALAHHYQGEVAGQPTALVHLDLYRLEEPAAAVELLAQEEEEARAMGAVLAVEWPERLLAVPQPCWSVELAFGGEGRVARLFWMGLRNVP